ncbi:hypothetical protein [Chryseobacterium joostei]|uniref:hypothetical protein n=1 Tax=Chryseobacterium joostei TaxID=112234 RepID=UPI003D123189
MKKLIFFCFLSISTVALKGQVGIGTQTPHSSAALDITSQDKGVLLPQVELVTLSNNFSPVNNPVVGLAVYNKGTVNTTIPKGHYYWNGNKWDRLIINNEVEQILSLTRFGGSGSPTPQPVVIPVGVISNNIITFDSVVKVNTIPGAALSPNGQDISLPAGIYRINIDYTGNSVNNAPSSSDFLGSGSVKLYVVNAGIVDGSNILLTDLKTSSQISSSSPYIFNFKFSYILQLTAPLTTVRLMMNHGTGGSDTPDLKAQQGGLLVTFQKFYQY